MPILAWVSLAGAAAAALLPPFAGFAGGWLLLQALFSAWRAGPLGFQLLTAGAVALLGLAMASLAAALLRFWGLCFLGRPRAPAPWARPRSRPCRARCCWRCCCCPRCWGCCRARCCAWPSRPCSCWPAMAARRNSAASSAPAPGPWRRITRRWAWACCWRCCWPWPPGRCAMPRRTRRYRRRPGTTASWPRRPTCLSATPPPSLMPPASPRRCARCCRAGPGCPVPSGCPGARAGACGRRGAAPPAGRCASAWAPW
ncbi:hypothetical protein ACFQU7_21940 [Pseudoroseomonas wenyumeiae]